MSQILVVDDSASIRHEVGGFLTRQGFKVTLAVDGRDGLDKLKQDPSIKLIFADVNMPVMDGITMIEQIRSTMNNTLVNILMLTTENNPELKARGRAAGIKGWIVKPFNGFSALSFIQKMVA